MFDIKYYFWLLPKAEQQQRDPVQRVPWGGGLTG
jgi:hypothetical protein